jgi:hypothetical protein
MAKRLRNQRGAGGIGCIFIVIGVGIGLWAGLQWAIPQLRHRSFDERITEDAGYFQRQTQEAVLKRVIDTAAEFDIPLSPNQVKVEIDANTIVIDVTYEKMIDIRFWQKKLTYHLNRRLRNQ